MIERFCKFEYVDTTIGKPNCRIKFIDYLPNQDSSSFVNCISSVDSLKFEITIPVNDTLTPIDSTLEFITNVTNT